jgi:hypothetical protein
VGGPSGFAAGVLVARRPGDATSDAVEELALLRGELLFGEDAAFAEVVELDQAVAYLEGDRARGRDVLGGR